MTTCAKCGKPAGAGSPSLRRAAGAVTWCRVCWVRPTSEEGWDRLTVNSKTRWVGGRVGQDASGAEDSDVKDPRDAEYEIDAWTDRDRGSP